MPDTADHRADMFRLGRQRRAAGLPMWDRKIRLGDVFHNEDMTFEQRRDAIIRRLRGTAWPARNGEVAELLDELAEAEDADRFNGVWEAIYDEADYDRVWIDTLSR